MDNTESTPHLSRSAEQLSELVGQLPLKDIVSETTDLIEKLCIEAAASIHNFSIKSVVSLTISLRGNCPTSSDNCSADRDK